VAPRTTRSAAARVGEHWGKHAGAWRQGGAMHWTELEAVQQRINRRVSGDPLVDPYQHVLRTYFADRLPVERAATLGCGTGELERGLVQYGFCARHDAFDIAEESVRKAREAARQAGLEHIHYEVGDVNRIELPAQAYDCVWGVHSIHHLAALEHVFGQVRRALKPGGYFVLNEFVGPTRFQWTDRQLEVINGVLHTLPARLRARCDGSGAVKREVVRPTIAEMKSIDPSEAVRSAEILSLLPSFFEVVQVTGYGGTVLQMLLHEIAGNFQGGDGAPSTILEAICDIEEALIDLGDLPHDFAVIVARGS
jgi:SAM-dependent methyltransferase